MTRMLRQTALGCSTQAEECKGKHKWHRAVAEGGDLQTSTPKEENFTCAVCLDLVHTPVVIGCGHVFCENCCLRAMDPHQPSACPVCRAPFQHLPRPCSLLAEYVQCSFPATHQKTLSQVSELVYLKLGDVPFGFDYADDYDGAHTDFCGEKEALFDLRLLDCTACSQRLRRPCILPCGHTVCRSCLPASHTDTTCPTCYHPAGNPRVCSMVEEVLRLCQHTYPAQLKTPEHANQVVMSPSSQNSSFFRRFSTALSRSLDQITLSSKLRSSNAPKPESEDHGNSYSIDSVPRRRAVSQDEFGISGDESDVDTTDLSPIGDSRNHLRFRRNCTVWGLDRGSNEIDDRTNQSDSDTDEEGHVVNAVAVIGEQGAVSFMADEFVHHGVGCDDCGMYPIIGRRHQCTHCTHGPSVDLCDGCYRVGYSGPGRFNPRHRAGHVFREIVPTVTWLHLMRALHPDLAVGRVVAMLHSIDIRPEEVYPQATVSPWPRTPLTSTLAPLVDGA